jgi:SAM-dependent methyltransferase
MKHEKMSYYDDKVKTLKKLFGTDEIIVGSDHLKVASHIYPIIQDVIILSDDRADHGLHKERDEKEGQEIFARDIQFTFSEEWKAYDRILPEHEKEFSRYFDIVDLKSLDGASVCDLGCGIGRWSYFLKDICRELVLVDFSDAIFVARRNLASCQNVLFFKGDIKQLPFKHDFCDFLFCLGVLHHLPTPCLEEVRSLRKYAPQLLIFLYYALDNRPAYFRFLLSMVTFLRRRLCKIRSPLFRKVLSVMGALFIYKPMILIGKILHPFHLSSRVPLYDFYHDKSFRRIEQDVYDRFFTRIEQRVTRRDIMTLKDSFSEIHISDNFPYWHFLCHR